MGCQYSSLNVVWRTFVETRSGIFSLSVTRRGGERFAAGLSNQFAKYTDCLGNLLFFQGSKAESDRIIMS